MKEKDKVLYNMNAIKYYIFFTIVIKGDHLLLLRKIFFFLQSHNFTFFSTKNFIVKKILRIQKNSKNVKP
jgi:hypothetical protein